MLHLHNGDCSAGVAARSGIPGEHLAWREALSDGPTPRLDSLDGWIAVRAAHLAGSSDVPLAECTSQLLEQERRLSEAGVEDEVILWVEHDLLCQVTLCYWLDAFAHRVRRPSRLSLVCISEFPGIDVFRGLGQLTPRQMASLFPDRVELTDRELSLGSRAWRAYTSPEPTEIGALLDENLDLLPFLEEALRLHLRRFPSTRDGLGLPAREALRLVAGGTSDFHPLFEAFGLAYPRLGLGDVQFLVELRRLASAGTSFLAERRDAASPPSYELTDAGRAALDGAADFVALNGIDLWLGGVHLRPDGRIWRWDPETSSLV